MGARPGSLSSIGAVAVGVILGSAVLFGLVGMLRSGDPVPEVAASPSEQVTEAPSEAASAEPTMAAPASEQASDVATQSEAAPTPEPTPGRDIGKPTAAPSEAASATPTEAPTESVPAGSVAPGDVTVQVLDATGSGTRAAAEAVADRLRAAGYRVIAVRSASKIYTDTTVFWSEGQGTAGGQIASEFGFPVVKATPDEVQLSDSVHVHVVVGTDEA